MLENSLIIRAKDEMQQPDKYGNLNNDICAFFVLHFVILMLVKLLFYQLLPKLFFSILKHNGGDMDSKGMRSYVPNNRDERLMRVMNFAYL